MFLSQRQLIPTLGHSCYLPQQSATACSCSAFFWTSAPFLDLFARFELFPDYK